MAGSLEQSRCLGFLRSEVLWPVSKVQRKLNWILELEFWKQTPTPPLLLHRVAALEIGSSAWLFCVSLG